MAPPIKKPPGVPNSAFDTSHLTPPPPAPAPAPMAKRKPARPATHASPLDPNAVVIRAGVPIPPRTAPRGPSVYEQLFNRMKPQTMAELNDSQANAFLSWGRKHGKKLQRRPLGEGRFGVWRTA